MARTARVKSKADGTAYYHLVARTTNKQFLLKDARAKKELARLICKAAEFSGIELEAWTIMDNHFHIACKVVRGEKVSQDEIVRRVRILKNDKAADELEQRWNGMIAGGLVATVESELDRYRARMSDISQFMKTLKELFAVWFNKEYKYCGSIWSGVFKSTMIEDGRYMSNCRKYIALNAVRAGIVRQVREYLWVWVRKDEESEIMEGCLPTWAMRRVAQLSSGKIYGSREYVETWTYRLGDKFPAASVPARMVGKIGYATHGWRLAKKDAAAKVVA